MLLKLRFLIAFLFCGWFIGLYAEHANSQPAELVGFADIHNHQFANLGFGGKAFVGNAFGPKDEALPHCDFVKGNLTNWVHGPGGVRDMMANVLGSFLVYNNLGPGHLVGGHDEFDGWPRWNSHTHQSVYQDWLERAVVGGLRLMVMLAVNNEDVCNIIDKAPGRSCNDMEAVDLQIQAAKDMEAFVDSQAGGAGKGWYRIVTSPAQARQVISEGKLAVVLGIEVDNLFNCHTDAGCSRNRLRQQLAKYHDLGVQACFPYTFQKK